MTAASKPSRWICLILTVLTTLALVGCSDEPEYPMLEEKLVIAADTGEPAALVWLAQDKGFFADFGLDVEVTPHSAGKLAVDALLDNRAQIATSSEFVVVKSSFDNPQLRILGHIASAENTHFTARKSAGITGPTDVKGKRLGVTVGSTGEYFLGRFLEAQGLSIEDVEIVNLAPPKIVEQMLAAEIDASITWHPNVYRIEQGLGDDALSFPAQQDQPFYFVLTTTADYLKSHEQHLDRYFRALLKAQEWIVQNPAELKAYITQKMDLDPAYADLSVEMFHWRVDFSQALLVAMDAEKRWAMEIGVVASENPPDFTDQIAPDAVEKVVGRVSVIH